MKIEDFLRSKSAGTLFVAETREDENGRMTVAVAESGWTNFDYAEFDLNTGREVSEADLIHEATELFCGDFTEEEADVMEKKLVHALPPTDPFLFRFRGVREKRRIL